jgi:hypothetical protein
MTFDPSGRSGFFGKRREKRAPSAYQGSKGVTVLGPERDRKSRMENKAHECFSRSMCTFSGSRVRRRRTMDSGSRFGQTDRSERTRSRTMRCSFELATPTCFHRGSVITRQFNALILSRRSKMPKLDSLPLQYCATAPAPVRARRPFSWEIRSARSCMLNWVSPPSIRSGRIIGRLDADIAPCHPQLCRSSCP